ncbi:MAG TPA: hypothetical protein VL500_06870 [Candidatus Eisenbacteria bacterium]|nr:hypothetical protein [Candidatus Eisenbacteria bacterium]
MDDIDKGASPYNAMAFYDGKEYFRPAGLARAFAGEDGRIAALPDIVAARLAAPDTDAPWQRPFTTASSEFFGYSRTGVPVIAVMHGNGPLADPEGVFTAYVSLRDDMGHGRLPQEEFLKICDGAYGGVEIVELRELYRLRRFPLYEMLTYEQACEDPLVRARLGGDAQAFLERHRRVTRAWLREQDMSTRDNDCVLSLTDTLRSGYGALRNDGWAYAHLLDISPLTDYSHGHWEGPRQHRCLVTELGVHDWGARVGAIGIRGDGPIGRLHPGPELSRTAFSRLWRRLARRAKAPAERMPLMRVFDGLWFTCHPGTGATPVNGEPDRPVRNLAGLDHVVAFRMPIVGGNHQVLTFDHGRVRARAPYWSDAYRIVGEARTVWEGSLAAYHVVHVEYCFADIESEWHIPPEREIERSFDLLLTLDESRA